MKKTSFLLLAFIGLAMATLAQVNRPHSPKNKQAGQGSFAKDLQLTEDQQKQANQFRAEFKKQMQDLNKNESITVKEYRDKKFAMQQEQKLKMRSLLTADQKNIIEQKKKVEMAKKDEQHAIKLNHLKTKLNLTDEQVNKLNKQRGIMKEKMMALKENNQLDRTAKKEKMMALKNEMKANRDKIFTPEQLKKMEEMKKNKPNKKAVKK